MNNVTITFNGRTIYLRPEHFRSILFAETVNDSSVIKKRNKIRDSLRCLLSHKREERTPLILRLSRLLDEDCSTDYWNQALQDAKE